MELIIVTGLSGSGKSTALNAIEDIDYFCIDNLPLELLLKFAQLSGENNRYQKIAVVTDIRLGNTFLKLGEYIEELKKLGFEVKVLYLDSSHDIIAKRYKETRRKHPLDSETNGDIELAIKKEHEILTLIRTSADYYIDTSNMPVVRLKESVLNIFLENIQDSMTIRCISFGFKHTIPYDADLVFDVRCLPNPFYIEALKPKTGLDDDIKNYVMSSPVSNDLFQKLCDLVSFLLPEYIREGKSRLVIAVGCTGGHHRSVVFSEKLAEYLRSKDYHALAVHRDISK